jgi:hypothetical protein
MGGGGGRMRMNARRLGGGVGWGDPIEPGKTMRAIGEFRTPNILKCFA